MRSDSGMGSLPLPSHRPGFSGPVGSQNDVLVCLLWKERTGDVGRGSRTGHPELNPSSTSGCVARKKRST